MYVCLACDNTFRSDDWKCPACGHLPEVIEGFISFAPDFEEGNEVFDEEAFEILAKVEQGHFWFETRNRLLTWALGRYFPKAESLLEIGCGTGFVLSGIRSVYPDISLSGSDVFSRGLSFARNRLPEVDLFQMDARRIPFENEFDVIGAFDVLEHIDEDDAVLAQMFRATRPGGGILLTVPQHGFLWSQMDELSHHKRRYSRKDLSEKVTRAGFEVVGVTSFVFLLLPLMLLNRFKRDMDREDYDLFEEFKINSALNWAFTRVLNLEMMITRGGLSLPAGGSLFIAARKSQS